LQPDLFFYLITILQLILVNYNQIYLNKK